MKNFKEQTIGKPSRKYDMFLAGAFQWNPRNIIYMPELHKLYGKIGELVETRYEKTIFVPPRDVKITSANMKEEKENHRVWKQFTEAEINSKIILANMDHYYDAQDLHIMFNVAMQHGKDIFAFYRGRRNPIIDSMKRKCRIEEIALREDQDTVIELRKFLDRCFTPVEQAHSAA